MLTVAVVANHHVSEVGKMNPIEDLQDEQNVAGKSLSIAHDLLVDLHGRDSIHASELSAQEHLKYRALLTLQRGHRLSGGRGSKGIVSNAGQARSVNPAHGTCNSLPAQPARSIHAATPNAGSIYSVR